MASCALSKSRVLTDHIKFACGHHVILLMKWIFSKCSFPHVLETLLGTSRKRLITTYFAMGSWLDLDWVFRRMRKFPFLLWPYIHPGLCPEVLHKGLLSGNQSWTQPVCDTVQVSARLWVIQSPPPLYLEGLPHWAFRAPWNLTVCQISSMQGTPVFVRIRCYFHCDKIYTTLHLLF